MTMRPFTDNRGGLNHLVDAQIGRAFPVVHKVYQHLDAIEYIAQVYEAGRARDIVIRTNHTKEWIEWQYKGEAKWTILFKFSDLLGADIADVVAAERALAAELEQLRLRLNNDAEVAVAARDAAIAARTGAEAAQAASVTARDAAQASRVAAAQSALTAGQHAQDLAAAKTAAQQSATQAAADRTLANQAAQTAQSQATAAGASATSAAEARQAAAGSAAEANAAKSATALLQSAAGQSQAAALGSANAAAVSATAAGVSAQTAATHQAAAEAAAATGAQHLADIEAQVVVAETLKQGTVAAHQAGLAAKDSAEAAAASAATFAENADVSAAASATSASEAGASATAAAQSSQEAATFAAETGSHAAAAASSAQQAEDKAAAAAASAQASAESASASEASQVASTTSATLSGTRADAAETSRQAAELAATRADEAQQTVNTVHGAVEQLHDETREMLLSVESLHGETQVFRNEAEQMRVDAQVVAAERQQAEDANTAAQVAANRAEDSAVQAASSEQATVGMAITVATTATELTGHLTNIEARLDDSEALRDQVQVLHDRTLEYKNAAQNSTINAQAVAADRAAVADMMGTITANAASAQLGAETAEALARAWATKMDGPVLTDGDAKFSAQYWATHAEQLVAQVGTFAGEWDAQRADYAVNEQVTYGALTYKVVAGGFAAAGVIPEGSDDWALVAEGTAFTGAFVAGTEYKKGDLAMYGPNTFRRTATGVSANFDADKAAGLWVDHTYGIRWMGAVQAGVTYHPGEVVSDYTHSYICKKTTTAVENQDFSSAGNESSDWDIVSRGQEYFPHPVPADYGSVIASTVEGGFLLTRQSVAVDADTQAVIYQHLFVDTNAKEESIVITLPVANEFSRGISVTITDVTGYADVYPIIIKTPDGARIEGQDDAEFHIDAAFGSFKLVFFNTTQGWKVL